VKPDGPITVPEDPAVLSAPLPFQLSHSIPCSAPLCVGMELGKRELLHECGQERCKMKYMWAAESRRSAELCAVTA
jgi:hypothetical protein